MRIPLCCKINERVSMLRIFALLIIMFAIVSYGHAQDDDDELLDFLPLLVLPRPLSGWVDMHTHPMSHLAFGGKLLHGAPDVGTLMSGFFVFPNGSGAADPPLTCQYDRPATPEAALSSDGPTHGRPDFSNPCGDIIRHELIRNMEAELRVKSRHEEDGAVGFPYLNSWPAYNDITHQQMWMEWIRRAHQGGLSVMVALAVNNATLAAGVMGTGDINGDDVASANVQIEEMVAMVNRHPDFMEVAKTSEDLRRIVMSGKLAVILGVNIHKDPAVDANNATEYSKNVIK